MRPVAAFIAMALLTASCDDGSIESRAGDERGGSTDTLLILPDDEDAGAPAPRGGGSGGGSDESPDTGLGPGGDGGNSSGDSGDGSGVGGGEAPLLMDDRAGVGAMGKAFLNAAVTDVVVEIDASPGLSLTDRARSALRRQIEAHGDKVSIGQASGSELPDQDVWTTAQLRALVERSRSSWSSGRRASLYVMVLGGRLEDEDQANAVGVAFSASAFAIFPEQLGGGLLGLNYAAYEEAVVVHELGHLFGLVNLTGQGAFHEDPQHEGHSTSSGSVMYWAVESTLVGEIFQGGPPSDFDADDVQEMDSIRD